MTVIKNTAYILLRLIIALRTINAQEYDLESYSQNIHPTWSSKPLLMVVAVTTATAQHHFYEAKQTQQCGCPMFFVGFIHYNRNLAV